MNDGNLITLCGAAASIGFLHTLLGPDHYVPFVAMSRVGRWSLSRTLVITTLCGLGHVLGSVLLGLIGIALGVGVFKLENIESFRGDLAGWLLLAFGVVYFAWGVRRAIRNRPHTHLHVHGDGTVHVHEHVHQGDHLHAHEAGAESDVEQILRSSESSAPAALATHGGGPTAPGGGSSRLGASEAGTMTPWILFTIFLFGPCEPLIPVLMYPAATGSYWGIVLVAAIFSAATIATMLTVVAVGYLGLGRLPFAAFHRYSHALGGFVLILCGAAVKFGL
jgi:nickel/cobalt transporter (NicO) family protein